MAANYILTPQDFLSRQEIAILMKCCKDRAERNLLMGSRTWVIRYMLVDLAFYSGLRVSEIASLKIGDLYLPATDPFILVRHGKGDKERAVYIRDELAGHLRWFIEEYKYKSLKQSIEDDAPLFAGQGGKHSPPITFMKSFKMAVTTAKLRDSISIHKARHTYATYLLKDSHDLRFVQKQLGHVDIAMTSLYADILPEDNGRLANSIHMEDDET